MSTKSNPGLPLDRVRAFEQKFDLRLPDDYVEYISRLNGEYPMNCWYRFHIGEYSMWTYNIGIKALVDESNPLCLATVDEIYQNYLEYHGWPRGWLPVAIGEGDTAAFFLCCVGEHRGEVWFQHSLPDDDGWWGSCIHCARSFNDFYIRLQPRQNGIDDENDQTMYL